MKTRKRELVRELLFSKSFSGKVKHRVKKELRDRATDELRTICIFRDRLRNDLRKKTRFFCSSSLDAENAQNAPSFCISLVRSRDEIETKRKEACELRTMCIFRDRLRNDLRKEKVRNYCVIIARRRERAKQKEERETTSHTNLSLSLSRLPLFCGVVRRKGSLTQREDYLLRGVGLLQ